MDDQNLDERPLVSDSNRNTANIKCRILKFTQRMTNNVRA